MKKQSGIAIVRQHIERIDGVSRTWFEWETDGDGMTNTLIVEVDFDTDGNSSDYRRNAMDAIVDTARQVLTDETTMSVGKIKIVPKL